MPGRACADLREAQKRAGDVLRWSNLRPRGYPEATLDAPRTTPDGQLGTRCHHRSIEPPATAGDKNIRQVNVNQPGRPEPSTTHRADCHRPLPTNSTHKAGFAALIPRARIWPMSGCAGDYSVIMIEWSILRRQLSWQFV
jgi:hypothetical protein